MASFQVDAYGDGQEMLLCTGCGELVGVVVTVQDKRGGASLCEDCLTSAWDALQAHLGSQATAEDGVAELG